MSDFALENETGFILTGTLGSGKSLLAAHIVHDAICEGRKVATNLDIFPQYIKNLPKSLESYEGKLIRLPNYVTVQSIQDLGFGTDYLTDRSTYGLLVLDETGLELLNARTWSATDRRGLLYWLLQSRKDGWETYVVAQAQSMLDKQIRDAFISFEFNCAVFSSLFSFPIKQFVNIFLPKKHICKVYKTNQKTTKRAKPLFRKYYTWDSNIGKLYNSFQKFPRIPGQKTEIISFVNPPVRPSELDRVKKVEQVEFNWTNLKKAFAKIRFYEFFALSAMFIGFLWAGYFLISKGIDFFSKDVQASEIKIEVKTDNVQDSKPPKRSDSCNDFFLTVESNPVVLKTLKDDFFFRMMYHFTPKVTNVIDKPGGLQYSLLWYDTEGKLIDKTDDSELVAWGWQALLWHKEGKPLHIVFNRGDAFIIFPFNAKPDSSPLDSIFPTFGNN